MIIQICKYLNIKGAYFNYYNSLSLSHRSSGPVGSQFLPFLTWRLHKAEAVEPLLLLLVALHSVRVKMGCTGSSQSKEDGALKKIRKPKPWKHPQPLTKTQLLQMREEFWDTAPHYGGRKEIWDALRAAGEADLSLAQAIVDSAGVIVLSADLTVCYDERGAKYELPKYVLSEPTNLIQES